MFFYSESEQGSTILPTSWSEVEKLVASDREASDQFGYSVAISSDGSTLAVGANAEDPGGVSNAGSVYLFTRSGSTWVETQKLVASDREANDDFGISVSISGDGSILAVGAYREDPAGVTDAGSVYLFTRSGSTWVETQKLVASDRQVGDLFGISVSISGDGSTLAVGAYAEDPGTTSNAGSVYLFTRSGSTWVETQKLVASDREVGDLFGRSVSISADGSTLAVGAYAEDPGGVSDAGSVYLFTRSGSTWVETQKLVASDREVGDEFGRSVSISSDGSTLAVGAHTEDPAGTGDAGSVYLFTRSGSTWVETQKLVASDLEASDHFGFSVSISSDGSTLAVGAYAEDPAGITDAGSVYLFARSGSTWVETQKLVASDREASDQFGFSVSISSDGSTLAVGARTEDPGGVSDAGSVYVFQGT